MQAAGLTARELRDVLIERFTEFIPSPQVSVIVTDVRSLKVLAVDEVARPGLTRMPTRLHFQRFLPRPSTAPYWWIEDDRPTRPAPPGTLGFAGCSMPSYDRSLHALCTWLDSWAGIGTAQ